MSLQLADDFTSGWVYNCWMTLLLVDELFQWCKYRMCSSSSFFKKVFAYLLYTFSYFFKASASYYPDFYKCVLILFTSGWVTVTTLKSSSAILKLADKLFWWHFIKIWYFHEKNLDLKMSPTGQGTSPTSPTSLYLGEINVYKNFIGTHPLIKFSIFWE